MGVVADLVCPREPCISHWRLFTATLAVMFLVCGSVNGAAQDRVILFESSRGTSGGSQLPGEIREVEITQGGRGWSVVRSVELPPHASGTPVALADGSRIMWLATESTSGLRVLVQYDVATARASIIDVGRFGRAALVLADRSAVRVFVVEPARITFLDDRLEPESMAFPGPKRIAGAYVADGSLVLQRYSSDAANDAELVVINTSSREVVRTLPLGQWSSLLVPRNAERIYRYYLHFGGNRPGEQRLDVISLTTGEVLARQTGVYWNYFFQFDESRGVVIHDRSVPRQSMVARDAATLAVVGEFAPGFFDRRVDWKLSQTSREAAILLFSREPIGGYFGERRCETASPRIDIFDGRTFALVNRIELQGSCPAIIPLPPR